MTENANNDWKNRRKGRQSIKDLIYNKDEEAKLTERNPLENDDTSDSENEDFFVRKDKMKDKKYENMESMRFIPKLDSIKVNL